MIYFLGYLVLAAFITGYLCCRTKHFKRDIELWHPMTVIDVYADADERAEVLRRHPEILESGMAGDTPAEFMTKYPDTAFKIFHVKPTVETKPRAVTLNRAEVIPEGELEIEEA